MPKRPPSQNDIGILIATAGMLFGVWLRLLPASLSSFPLNDGGLFYVMLNALIENGFRLPHTVSYNGLAVPFAYPPLAFYAGGWIAHTFGVSLLDLLRWMPAVVTALTMAAFFDLARTLLKSDFEAGLATLVFAFIPRALTWMLMGGGLTRSFGELFFIIAVRFIYSAFTTSKAKDLALAIVFSALVVLSHPEATLHTMGFALLAWLIKARNARGVKQALTIAIGVIILTAPWWIVMLGRYGLSPYFSAAQTGDQKILDLITVFLVAVSEEPYLTPIAILGFLGVFAALERREYLLPAMFFLPFILEPRNAANVVIVFLAMLAALTLAPYFRAAFTAQPPGTVPAKTRPWSAGTLAAILFLIFFTNAAFVATRAANNHLTEGTLTAFEWIAQNTPPGSRFAVLTGEAESFCDPVQEWFPIFTGRVSQTTPQGREWLTGETFAKYRKELTVLQRCLEKGAACLEAQVRKMELDYDYLYIQRKSSSRVFCIPRMEITRGGNLILALEMQQPAQYEQVYFTDDVVIYKRNP